MSNASQSQLELLEAVLRKTQTLLDNVTLGDADRPTPCPEYDVRRLVGHVVSSMQFFAARAEGSDEAVDLESYEPAFSTTADFQAARNRLVSAFRNGAGERTIQVMGSEITGNMLLGMTLSETIVHGWDVARATRQSVPFTEEEAAAALVSLEAMLQPEYRGVMFGEAVPVPEDAPALQRLVAFAGRDPRHPLGAARTAYSSFTLDTWEPETWSDEGTTLTKVRVTKTFSGDIEGTSEAHLVTAVNENPAAYVGIERLAVSADGRKGGLVLHHSAGVGPTGAPVAHWTVVAGSGTGELAGITGAATFDVRPDGAHFLELTYELPE